MAKIIVTVAAHIYIDGKSINDGKVTIEAENMADLCKALKDVETHKEDWIKKQ